MVDLTRPGSTIGGYRVIGGGSSGRSTFKAPSLHSDNEGAPSLLGQFGDVLRGLPGGLATFAGKTLQTAAAPVHLAIDAVRHPEDFANIKNLGDFTDEYLPVADMVTRSMYHTLLRVRHPTQYYRAVQEGRIVGTILEDLGNAAIVTGGLSSALGAAAKVGTAAELAGAAEAGAAAGSIGETIGGAAARAAAKLERGSGLAGAAERAGYTTLAENLEKAGTGLKYGSHKLDFVASQPFPLLRSVSGKLGESIAPWVERGVTERLGREFEIPRTPGKDLRLSEVARASLAGTAVGRTPVLSRLIPEVQDYVEQVGSPHEANQLRAQMDVSKPGEAVEQVAREQGVKFAREDDPNYERLSKATTLNTIGDMRDQVRRWADEYRAVKGTPDEPAFHDTLGRRLGALMEGASDSSQIVDAPTMMTLIERELGNLPEADNAFIDTVGPALRGMYAKAEEMGREGVGGRAILPEEMGTAPLPIAVNRERARLEARREPVLRKIERAYKDMTREQVKAEVMRLTADELPQPPKIREVFQRGQSVERAAQGERAAIDRLRQAREVLRREYDDYERATDPGDITAKMKRVEQAAKRVEELQGVEAELRRTQGSRISGAKVKRAEPPAPPEGPSTGPPEGPPPQGPPDGGAGPAPAAAQVVPEPRVEPEQPKLAEAAKGRKAVKTIAGLRRAEPTRARVRRASERFARRKRLKLPDNLPDARRALADMDESIASAGKLMQDLRDERRQFAPDIKELDRQLAAVDAMPEEEMVARVKQERTRMLGEAERVRQELGAKLDAVEINPEGQFISPLPGRVRTGTDARGRPEYKLGWKRNGQFVPAGGEWDWIERISKKELEFLKRHQRKGFDSSFGPDVIVERFRAKGAEAGFTGAANMSDEQIMATIVRTAREHAQLSGMVRTKGGGLALMLKRGVPASLADIYPGDLRDLFIGTPNTAELRRSMRAALEDELTDHGKFAPSAYYDKAIADADRTYNEQLEQLTELDQHVNRLDKATTQRIELAPEESGQLFGAEKVKEKSSNEMEDALWKFADAARETNDIVRKIENRKKLIGSKREPGAPPRETKIALAARGEEAAPTPAAPKVEPAPAPTSGRTPAGQDFADELRNASIAGQPKLLARLGIEVPQAWRARKTLMRGMDETDVYAGLQRNRVKAFERTGREINTTSLESVDEVRAAAGDDAYVVISCGSTKLGSAAPAADLYTSDTFKKNLAAARAITGGDDSRIRIVSAKHGYVPLDQVLEPYDVSFTSKTGEGVIDVNTMRAQATKLPKDASIVVLGGKEYVGAVAVTAGDRTIVAPYAGTNGIGTQRRIANQLAAVPKAKPKIAEVAAPAAPSSYAAVPAYQGEVPTLPTKGKIVAGITKGDHMLGGDAVTEAEFKKIRDDLRERMGMVTKRNIEEAVAAGVIERVPATELRVGDAVLDGGGNVRIISKIDPEPRYEWTDDAGKTHYEDTPPPKGTKGVKADYRVETIQPNGGGSGTIDADPTAEFGTRVRVARSGLPEGTTPTLKPTLHEGAPAPKLAEDSTGAVAPSAPVPVEPAAAAAGGAGGAPPVEPPTPAAPAAGGPPSDRFAALKLSGEKAKLPVARGRRLESERQLRREVDSLVRADAKQTRVERQLHPERETAKPQYHYSVPGSNRKVWDTPPPEGVKLSAVSYKTAVSRIRRARHAVSQALDDVERTGRAAEATAAFGELTPEERQAALRWRRTYNKEGELASRSYAETLNRAVGSQQEKARVATARHAQLTDQAENLTREIATVELEMERPVQAHLRELIHGKGRLLSPKDRLPDAGIIKEGDWIELEDGKWGRVSGVQMKEVRENGRVVIDRATNEPKMEFDGWRVHTDRGNIEHVPVEGNWRWTKDNRGQVGVLRRQLRKLREPFGHLTTKIESLDIDPEMRADMAASGIPTTREVPIGKGLVWETLGKAVARVEESGEKQIDMLIQIGNDLDRAATDRERYGYLESNAERLGLRPGEVRQLEESMRVDEKLATMDAMVGDYHKDGSWMDLPFALGRHTEDLEFASQEWQNVRNKITFSHKDRRVRLLADNALNVESMPAKWRASAQFARREVKFYIDEASRLQAAGDELAAREQLSIAADVATNVRDLAEAGVDPIYAAGGRPTGSIGLDATVGRSQLTDTQRRRTPFKPLTIEGAQRLTLDRMLRRYRNQAYDIVETNFGRTPSSVPGMEQWIADFVAEHDRYPMPDEYQLAFKDRGWVPLDRNAGVAGVKTTDRIAQRQDELNDAITHYDEAITSGSDARIQRARYELDEAERTLAQARTATPKALRDAYRNFENARDEMERIEAQDTSGQAFAGEHDIHPDVRMSAFRKMQDAMAELARAEEAGLPKLVPDTIAREMRRDASLWEQGTLPGFKMLARSNRFYKTQVLPLSMRWYINNTLGNVIMAGAFGGVGPIDLLRNIRRVRKELQLGHGVGRIAQGAIESGLLEGALDVGQVRGARIAQSGLFETQRRGLGLADFDQKPARTRVGAGVRRVTDAGYGINEFFDNVNRSAVYLSKMEKYLVKAGRAGLDLSTPAAIEKVAAAALKDTLKAMGDYTNMAPWQRKYLRQVFPWWSWIRHSTVAAMRLPIEHPMRAAWLAQLSVLANDKGLTGEELAFYSGRWMLGDGTTSVSFGTLSPLEDPMQNPLFNPPALLRSMAPGLKIGIAAATGVDMNRLGQTTRPTKDQAKGAFGQSVADPLMGEPGNLLGYAVGQFPLLKNIRDVIEGPGVRYGTGQKIVNKRTGKERPSGKTRINSLASILGAPYPEKKT